MVSLLKKKINFTLSVRAMRLEELLSIISNGDTNKKLREEASKELDNRRVTLANINRII